MLSQKMQDALNAQINEELYSSYLYLAMAAHFRAKNLKGFAQWMRVQSKEEMGHAMKIFDYIDDRLGRTVFKELAKPTTDWPSPLAAFENAYKHEQHITGCIHDLMNLAVQEKDYATQSFLKWFVDEQVEEEAAADEVVQKLRLAGDSQPGLFLMDRELGQRSSE